MVTPFISSSTGQISSARILNEIVLGGGSTSWFYCTQQPDPEGNVTTVFNTSSTAGFVSLDKPPVAFWLQTASAKLFGFGKIAVLLPQIVEG